MNFAWNLMFLFVVIHNAMTRAEGALCEEEDSNGAQVSVNDLAWQSLHVAAAAACRGSTPTGGSGTHVNVVLARNSRGPKSCKQLCAATPHTHCDAEVSVYGYIGKATGNGEIVGKFYNYGCDLGVFGWGGNEASAPDQDITSPRGRPGDGAFSFCCCRKD